MKISGGWGLLGWCGSELESANMKICGGWGLLGRWGSVRVR